MISCKNPFGIASIRKWPFLLVAWSVMAYIAYMFLKLPLTIYLVLFFFAWVILFLLVTYKWASAFESIWTSILAIVVVTVLYAWSTKFQPGLRMYPGISQIVIIFIQMAFASVALLPIVLICIVSAFRDIYKKGNLKTLSGFLAAFFWGFSLLSTIFFYTGWPLILRYWWRG